MMLSSSPTRRRHGLWASSKTGQGPHILITIFDTGEGMDRDGEEALRGAAEHEAPIGLVLTDVVIPRMNGPEVLKRLIERFPSIKGVLMSGHADDALVHHGVIDEGPPFIEKPFTRHELSRRIREVMDG